MEKWFQREITQTSGAASTTRGTHKRQSIRDLHREMKGHPSSTKGSVTMYVQDSPEEPIKSTLIHQAEVTKRGRVKVLEL
jgi:hypothetical protein